MPNPENLKPFKKGYDKRRENNGRPKKLVGQLNDELKAEGYETVSNSQVMDCFQTMLNLPLKKITEIADKSSDYPLLYKLVAKELLGKNGGNQLEKLLDRVFGKAKQSTDITTDGEKITGINIRFIDGSKRDNENE